VSSPTQRRELLKAVYERARVCTDCGLHQTRTTVVFGSGNANADLMFVGEAPGATEDKMGLPFVGQAGKLLDKLLAEIEMQRSDVFIANVLKCRPPNNRDPQPSEIESCRHYLHEQVELIEPIMICTLGNFSTKLLRADPTGITRLHGREETRLIGARAVRLYPIFHPAAALYTPSMVETLRTDFLRIPAILAQGPPPQPPAIGETPELASDDEPPEIEWPTDPDELVASSPEDEDPRPSLEDAEPPEAPKPSPNGKLDEGTQLGLF
jgi:DNA polymerase